MRPSPTSLSQPVLAARIESFDIDGGPAQLTFAKRLARENGWSVDYAERVIREYKRFAYLCMAAGHPCTPSDEVDQAWHLHMLYSESYWDRFCGEVLGKPLKHGPTKGGQLEDEKFSDWYEQTKEAYVREFGEKPPADIWPPSEVRFGLAPHFRRVNTRDHWVIPKASVRRSASFFLVATLGLFAIGCTVAATNDERKTAIIIAVIALCLLLLLVALVLIPKGRGHSQGGGSGCGWSSTGFGSGCGSRDDSSAGDDSGGSSGCGSSGCGSSGCGGGGCGGGD